MAPEETVMQTATKPATLPEIDTRQERECERLNVRFAAVLDALERRLGIRCGDRLDLVTCAPRGALYDLRLDLRGDLESLSKLAAMLGKA
jgi:hypothetical protein